MKIVICDDDKQELLQIRQFLDEYLSDGLGEEKIEVSSFEAVQSSSTIFESDKYFNIYFLDVIMPGSNGIELAAEIRNKDQVAKIVFLTSSSEFAVESYSVNAFYYLLKPIQKDKLLSVLKKPAMIFAAEQKNILFLKTKNGLLKIFMHELMYVEVIGRTTFFHQTNRDVIEGISTISKVEAILLTDKRFIKPHRSYIVNLDHVNKLSPDGFTTTNGTIIPISRNTFKDVKQKYINYSFQEDY